MSTRREFLTRGIAGAVAAAAVGGVALPVVSASTRGMPSAVGRPMSRQTGPRTLRKAVMIGMVGEGETILDKLMIVRDSGFAGIELDSPNPLKPDDVLAAAEKTGMKIHGLVNSVHWSRPLNSPDAAVRGECIAALRTNIADAWRYGATSILFVPAVVRGGMPYDEAWRVSQQELAAVLPEAAEAGVKISIENVWNNFLLSPLEAARYVDEMASPAGAFHFDIGNVVNFGWPEQWIRVLGARIERIHIKDFSRTKRDEQGLWKGFDVELGEGDAGWKDTMRALDEIGYSTDPTGRWATAEVRGGGRERLKQISDQMDAIFAA